MGICHLTILVFRKSIVVAGNQVILYQLAVVQCDFNVEYGNTNVSGNYSKPLKAVFTIEMIEKLINSKSLSLYLISSVTCFFASCGLSRNGEQMYLDFLGEPTKNCVNVVTSEDRQAIDDASAFLYFKICPAELKRILNQRDYDKKILAKSEAYSDETVTYGGIIPNWWTPSKLGDSCILYTYFDQNTDWAEHLYVSFDSTAVYYRDDRY